MAVRLQDGLFFFRLFFLVQETEETVCAGDGIFQLGNDARDIVERLRVLVRVA